MKRAKQTKVGHKAIEHNRAIINEALLWLCCHSGMSSEQAATMIERVRQVIAEELGKQYDAMRAAKDEVRT